MEERLREVVRHIGPTAVGKATGMDRSRWNTVANDTRTKTRVEDLSRLLQAFPEYELYIIRGEIDPSRGQISPAYDHADLKLEGQTAGSN